ncbi:MAG: hypothetical protein ACM3NR_00765 [Methanosarcina sp.]
MISKFSNIIINAMKRSAIPTGKILGVLFSICSLFMLSCQKDYCPTYMAPRERVRSMRGMEINGSWERKAIPSPRQTKRRNLPEADTLLAAGSRIVIYYSSIQYKEI